MSRKLNAAIICTGLMIKILSHGEYLEMWALAGIDAASDGLAREKETPGNRRKPPETAATR